MTRLIACAALALALAAPAAHAQKKTDCKLTFQMSGWSAFYKTAPSVEDRVHKAE